MAYDSIYRRFKWSKYMYVCSVSCEFIAQCTIHICEKYKKYCIEYGETQHDDKNIYVDLSLPVHDESLAHSFGSHQTENVGLRRTEISLPSSPPSLSPLTSTTSGLLLLVYFWFDSILTLDFVFIRITKMPWFGPYLHIVNTRRFLYFFGVTLASRVYMYRMHDAKSVRWHAQGTANSEEREGKKYNIYMYTNWNREQVKRQFEAANTDETNSNGLW